MNAIIIFLIIVAIAVVIMYFLYGYFSKPVQKEIKECKPNVFKEDIKEDNGIISKITKEENLL